MATRFLWQNFAHLGNSSVSASSELSTKPASWMRDQQREKAWTSKTGWNVVAGWNDKLDVDEGGVARVATLTAGNYATAALYAAHVQAALNAMSGAVNTYTVSYSSNKFTIARSTGSASVSLLWSTGANAAKSAGRDLGFTVSADDTGSTSYLADGVSYHSREYVAVALASALEVKAAVAMNHNAGADGTFTLQWGSTSIAASLTAPTGTQALTGNSTLRAAFFSAVTYRYWALVIDDVANSVGYSSLSVPYVGSYFEPSYGVSAAMSVTTGDLSTVEYADGGAHFADINSRIRTRDFSFAALSTADKESFETMLDFVKLGRALFFTHDHSSASNMLYCFFDSSPSIIHYPAATARWRVEATLREVV